MVGILIAVDTVITFWKLLDSIICIKFLRQVYHRGHETVLDNSLSSYLITKYTMSDPGTSAWWCRLATSCWCFGDHNCFWFIISICPYHQTQHLHFTLSLKKWRCLFLGELRLKLGISEHIKFFYSTQAIEKSIYNIIIYILIYTYFH